MKNKAKILILGAFVLAIGLVGNADYQDEVEYGQYQCEMARQGYWPDPGFCGGEDKQ